MGWGGSWDGRNTCTPVADSCQCMAKPTTILSNQPPIKINNFKKIPKKWITRVKLLQSCLALCDTMDRILPGSSVHRILQARILKWVAMPFSRVSSCIAGGFFTGWATREAQLGKMEGTQLYACMLSLFNHVLLFATIWTVTLQASLSMEFSRQEYWSGLPCPSPGDLPDPGMELISLVFPALVGSFFNS